MTLYNLNRIPIQRVVSQRVIGYQHTNEGVVSIVESEVLLENGEIETRWQMSRTDEEGVKRRSGWLLNMPQIDIAQPQKGQDSHDAV